MTNTVHQEALLAYRASLRAVYDYLQHAKEITEQDAIWAQGVTDRIETERNDLASQYDVFLPFLKKGSTDDRFPFWFRSLCLYLWYPASERALQLIHEQWEPPVVDLKRTLIDSFTKVLAMTSNTKTSVDLARVVLQISGGKALPNRHSELHHVAWQIIELHRFSQRMRAVLKTIPQVKTALA